jgi:hypothetical protein
VAICTYLLQSRALPSQPRLLLLRLLLLRRQPLTPLPQPCKAHIGLACKDRQVCGCCCRCCCQAVFHGFLCSLAGFDFLAQVLTQLELLTVKGFLQSHNQHRCTHQ